MPTIGIDFDGVLHRYSKGWHDGTIYDPPMEGALEALESLLEDYAVFIFTCRDIQSVCEWLQFRGVCTVSALPGAEFKFWNNRNCVLVTNQKIPAIAYIDDKAIRFDNWYQALNDLERYANLGSRSG